MRARDRILQKSETARIVIKARDSGFVAAGADRIEACKQSLALKRIAVALLALTLAGCTQRRILPALVHRLEGGRDGDVDIVIHIEIRQAKPAPASSTIDPK